MAKWKIEKLDFFRGWVVLKSYGDRDQYWDFPEAEYGVLDSMVVKAHKTKEEAEAAMAELTGQPV